MGRRTKRKKLLLRQHRLLGVELNPQEARRVGLGYIIDEQERIKEEAEQKRLDEENRIKAEAEVKRLAEEKKRAEEKARKEAEAKAKAEAEKKKAADAKKKKAAAAKKKIEVEEPKD